VQVIADPAAVCGLDLAGIVGMVASSLAAAVAGDYL
jgi:hypothetical protein